MNEFYMGFIEAGRQLARSRGLKWDLPFDEEGEVETTERWNLTALAGMVPPPTFWLSNVAFDVNTTAAINEIRAAQGAPRVPSGIMSGDWQDLYKAAVLSEIVAKRNKPRDATNRVARGVKILATAAGETPPWDLDADTVQLAFNAALRIGESGKMAANLQSVIRVVIDGLHLADRSPLERFCVPYPSMEAQAAARRAADVHRRADNRRSTATLRKELAERKRSERLPSEAAFWELVRIVFTETPQSLTDALRFAQVKLAIVTGFRIGENVMLPADWERWREYIDLDGKPAGEKGGISRSLMIRHFAEKQAADEGPEGVILYETAQHVPQLFEDVVLTTLHDAERITRPMRERLRLQTKAGRLLPEFEPDDLALATDLYTRVGGGLWFLNEPPPEDLVVAYRKTYDPDFLERIRAHQESRLPDSRPDAVKKYWFRFLGDGLVTPRDASGAAITGTLKWKRVYLRVGEVEEMIRRQMPTKLPDLTPFTLADGSKLYPYDLMFLFPVRSLVDNRNAGIVDTNRYFSVGRASTDDLILHLGLSDDNLFTRYGASDEAKTYKIDSHSLRHLQNAELFRLGIADTIITKRFNRRTVVQSYEYDHRSLAEDLSRIELPPEASERMGPRAQEVFKMIQARRVSGPVVDEFRRIQAEDGDEAAFDYLEAEADGLHVTPYGFCLNAFTVDPCPKHLECFNGCRHLARSEVPTERTNLERVRDRMLRIIQKIESAPLAARNVGWRNQLAHARTRLANIEKALAAAPGQQPFPDGPDLYRPLGEKLGTTILDRRPLPSATSGHPAVAND